MKTEKELIKETEKWTRRLETELDAAKPVKKKGERFLDNVKSYTSDSKHFFDKKDYVRAFEAVVWAWAFLSIGKDMGLVKVDIKTSS